jgi:hypothetical protein
VFLCFRLQIQQWHVANIKILPLLVEWFTDNIYWNRHLMWKDLRFSVFEHSVSVLQRQ